jgi:dTMP kinase
LITQLEQVIIGPDWPELTLILDLPVELGLQRALARGGGEYRFESKGLAFHDRLRSAFLDIAAAEPGRCRVIDASADTDTIADRIWDLVQLHFNLSGG